MTKREGPSIRIDVDCFGCVHTESEKYQCQGDSGRDVYCIHPQFGSGENERRHIGDTKWTTPDWCPVRQKALSEFLTALAVAAQ